jgi:hypothetical protein
MQVRQGLRRHFTQFVLQACGAACSVQCMIAGLGLGLQVRQGQQLQQVAVCIACIVHGLLAGLCTSVRWAQNARTIVYARAF